MSLYSRFGSVLLLLGCVFAAPHLLPAQDVVADAGFNGSGAIRPGDQISIRVWRDTLMSGEFTVDHAGDAVLPRLGVVRVAGRPAVELQQWLRNQYMEYVRHPSIEVTLLRRVGIHGEVRKPDLYMVDLTVTLRDLIAMAGGLTEQGDPGKIEIVRDGTRVRVGANGGGRFVGAELQSGDQVVVGRRNWLVLNPLAIISTAITVASFLLVAFR